MIDRMLHVQTTAPINNDPRFSKESSENENDIPSAVQMDDIYTIYATRH